MLQEFITSALIIDDKPNEIEGLEKHLDSVGIWAKHYTPENLINVVTPFNNRKLIFLDLYIDESDSTLEGNISKIRKHFEKVIGNDFGSYGIALWTKDPEKVQTFSDKIFNTGNKYSRPLFVIALDKTKYLRSNNFSTLLSDLELELSKDVAASFFVEWNKAVKKGSDNTITTLYDLFESNDKKNKHLEAILLKLACNYTGITDDNLNGYNLQIDLIKSLMDTLQFEISSNYENIENLFLDPKKCVYNENPEEKTLVFSKLNSLLMLDTQNSQQVSVIPGNIYEVLDRQSPLYIKDITYKKKLESLDSHPMFKEFKKRRICIEVTPPCDFAQNKKQSMSRIIGGVQMDFDKQVLKGNASPFKTENYYTFLYPVNIKDYDKPQMMIFDFYRFQTIKEDELKDNKKFKIIMKAKDKLFADVLQKLSSHTARLGIAILYPNR